MYRAPVEDIAFTLKHVAGLKSALDAGCSASVAPFCRGALRRARWARSRRLCERVSDRSHSTAEPRSRSDLGYGSSSDGRESTLGAPFLLLCLRGELTGSRGEVALHHVQ